MCVCLRVRVCVRVCACVNTDQPTQLIRLRSRFLGFSHQLECRCGGGATAARTCRQVEEQRWEEVSADGSSLRGWKSPRSRSPSLPCNNSPAGLFHYSSLRPGNASFPFLYPTATRCGWPSCRTPSSFRSSCWSVFFLHLCFSRAVETCQSECLIPQFGCLKLLKPAGRAA